MPSYGACADHFSPSPITFISSHPTYSLIYNLPGPRRHWNISVCIMLRQRDNSSEMLNWTDLAPISKSGSMAPPLTVHKLYCLFKHLPRCRHHKVREQKSCASLTGCELWDLSQFIQLVAFASSWGNRDAYSKCPSCYSSWLKMNVDKKLWTEPWEVLLVVRLMCFSEWFS